MQGLWNGDTKLRWLSLSFVHNSPRFGGKKTQINLKFETDFVKKGKIFVNLILSHRHLGSTIVHIQALADVRGVHTQDNNKNTLYEQWDIYEFTYIHFEKMHYILLIYV